MRFLDAMHLLSLSQAPAKGDEKTNYQPRTLNVHNMNWTILDWFHCRLRCATHATGTSFYKFIYAILLLFFLKDPFLWCYTLIVIFFSQELSIGSTDPVQLLPSFVSYGLFGPASYCLPYRQVDVSQPHPEPGSKETCVKQKPRLVYLLNCDTFTC